MKQLLILLLALLPVVHAAGGGFATPAEFGYPPLTLEPPQHLIPAGEREWCIAGQPPLRAKLRGIKGRWGNQSTVILRTPSGRDLSVPAQALSDADLESVSDWLKKNNFEEFETYREGTSLVRVLSVIPLREDYHVDLVLTDGSRIALRTSSKSVNREYAIRWPLDAFWVTDSTLEMLRRHIGRKPAGKPELPIATTTDEAMLYAAMHDVGIAVLYLNRRGSAIDLAFRRYLAGKPELVAQWAQHFVFLLAYEDERGMDPTECHNNALTQTLVHSFEGTSANGHSDTSHALMGIRLAWLSNTNYLAYRVHLHNMRSGNPHQQKFTTREQSGSASIEKMLNLRDDAFRLFGH